MILPCQYRRRISDTIAPVRSDHDAPAKHFSLRNANGTRSMSRILEKNLKLSLITAIASKIHGHLSLILAAQLFGLIVLLLSPQKLQFIKSLV